MNVPYNVTSAALTKFRWQARNGLAELSYEERRAYGEAIERAILAKQRSELQGSIGPIKPRVRCASGTDYSDGADIHEAVRKARGERGIWQRRFWEHLIRDEADYARHVEYCYINPVKHSLVTQVCDWPHSSFHRDVKRGIFPEDWAGDADSTGEFGEVS
jgi:hypothetical protein